MQIRFTKKPNPPHVLTCVRDDGSVTRAAVEPAFIVHDLTHYAVETTLGLRDSFYALLARGWDIQSFDVPGATKRLDIPAEAQTTEFLVGLLQTEQLTGEPRGDFNAEVRNAVERAGHTAREPISDDDLARIRECIAEIIHQWRGLPVGETLELTWV
jgi:hypothetical protein